MLSTPSHLTPIMCRTKEDHHERPASDASFDEERMAADKKKRFVGYRGDLTAAGASPEQQKFQARVDEGDVYVGECDNKYHLIKRVAGGSFGEVYLGEDKDGRHVAVKIEPQTPGASFLFNEGNVYRNLAGGPGMPDVGWFGLYNSDYGAMVMDLLGPTLSDLLERYKPLSLKTVLQLADQMISIIAHVHQHGYLHRDISPSNFLFGTGKNADKLFLIDFGHAKKYSKVHKIVPVRRRPSLPRCIVGTPRFIGVHVHLGHEDSPRDDLESLVYIFIYLLKGRLPWQGLPAKSMPEKLSKIGDKKLSLPIDEICNNLPKEFAICLEYVRSLKQYDIANYEGLREHFRRLAASLDITYDNQYEWTGDSSEDAVEGMPDRTDAPHLRVDPPSRNLEIEPSHLTPDTGKLCYVEMSS